MYIRFVVCTDKNLKNSEILNLHKNPFFLLNFVPYFHAKTIFSYDIFLAIFCNSKSGIKKTGIRFIRFL